MAALLVSSLIGAMELALAGSLTGTTGSGIARVRGGSGGVIASGFTGSPVWGCTVVLLLFAECRVDAADESFEDVKGWRIDDVHQRARDGELVALRELE